MSTKATRVFSGIGQAFFHLTSKGAPLIAVIVCAHGCVAKEETHADPEFQVDTQVSEFIPSREAIASAMFEFAERESFLHQDFRMRSSQDGSGEGSHIFLVLTVLLVLNSRGNLTTTHPQITVLQELMRAQGTLNAITTGSITGASLEGAVLGSLFYLSPRSIGLA